MSSQSCQKRQVAFSVIGKDGLSTSNKDVLENKSVDGKCRAQKRSPFLIGVAVAGGTASGKSSVCEAIVEKLGQEDHHHVEILSSDSFYFDLTPQQIQEAKEGRINFDHPSAIDFRELYSTLRRLQAGETVQIFPYDMKTHCRKLDEPKEINPSSEIDVVIVEGILTFYDAEVRNLFYMKLFVDTDPDTRLARRVLRDHSELGRDLDKILSQYVSLVKPAFEEFCLPTKKYADIIIPKGKDNEKAISLIVQHIQDLLRSSRQGSPDRNEDGETSGRPIEADRMFWYKFMLIRCDTHLAHLAHAISVVDCKMIASNLTEQETAEQNCRQGSLNKGNSEQPQLAAFGPSGNHSEPITCEKCKMGFTSKCELRRHKRSIHSHNPFELDLLKNYPLITDSESGSNLKKAKCPICRIVVKPLHLHGHLKRHFESFKCAECKKEFHSRADLKAHIELHYSVQVVCPECGMGFKSKTVYRSHKARKHKGKSVAKSPCPICRKEMRTDSIKRHLLTQHHVKDDLL